MIIDVLKLLARIQKSGTAFARFLLYSVSKSSYDLKITQCRWLIYHMLTVSASFGKNPSDQQGLAHQKARPSCLVMLIQLMKSYVRAVTL
jgi:hypothetical protein